MDEEVTSFKIKNQLLGADYEHPFRWDPQSFMKFIPNDILNKYSDILSSTSVIDPELQFEYLMMYIGQSHAYGIIDQYQQALDSLQNGEKKFLEFTNNAPNNNTMYSAAFLHVLRSTRAFLFTLMEDINAACEVLPFIPKIADMDGKNLASLSGLKALFYGAYALEGFKMSVDLFSKAIEINPSEPSWHFLKGKYLGRIRHLERPIDLPNEEEVTHLELAATMKKNGTYTLFLAQLCQETSNRIFKHNRNSSKWSESMREEVLKLNEKSSDLFKESLKLEPESPQILFRCAKGFMRLPPPYRDRVLAKTLLLKGLTINPDSGFGHHAMAQYYERLERNPRKAIEHLEICHSQKMFPASVDLIRLRYEIDKRADNVVANLEALLDDHKEPISRGNVLAHLTAFTLLTLNDRRRAYHYASEIRRLSGSYDLLLQHLPICGIGSRPYISKNIYEVLVDEIKIALLDRNCAAEEKEHYEAFLKELTSSNTEPVIPVAEPPQYLKKRIILDGQRKQNYRSSTTNKNHVAESRSRLSGQPVKFENRHCEKTTRGNSSAFARKDTGENVEGERNYGNKIDDEIAESMRKARVGDHDRAGSVNQPIKKSNDLAALFKAVANKYCEHE